MIRLVVWTVGLTFVTACSIVGWNQADDEETRKNLAQKYGVINFRKHQEQEKE